MAWLETLRFGEVRGMKPSNRFYDCSPPDPGEAVMVNCTHCRKSSYSSEWIKNRGDCPRCNKKYAGKNEDS